jgi:hypothetical protein
VETSDRAHFKRLMRYVIAVVAIELALLAISHLSPALGTLFQPIYYIVPALFAVPAWQAFRRRKGGDRRHASRRNRQDGSN